MVETDIKIGPVRPISGPLAKTGGAAVSSQSGSGPLDVRVRQNEVDVRSLQDQIFAISGLLNLPISVPMLIASGGNHQPGVVPDPGPTAGTTKFLREDATWSAVSATALTGILPVVNGGTGTATGSITGTGDLTFTAGGSNKSVTLVSSGTGKVVSKPGTDSTTAIQSQDAAGNTVAAVDTTNQALLTTSTGTADDRGVGASQYNAGTHPARMRLVKARGTPASPVTVVNGDNIGQVIFNAFGTTMFPRAAITAMVSAAVSVDLVPTDLVISTGNGASTAERMRVVSTGEVLIGTGTVGASLVRIVGLPTSAAGLSAGDLWVDTGAGNVLKVA